MTGTPTAPDLLALLRAKFPENAYAVLEEVRDGAGFDARHSTDAIVMGLWPSRGLRLEGFEIKVSRPDWLREVRKPEKAESLYRYCDHWWLLGSSSDIVQDLELPATWGLLVPKGRGLGVAKPAPLLTPQPLDRPVLAALLKRAWMRSPVAEAAKKAVEQARKEGVERGLERARFDREQLDALEKRIAAFEEASGVRLDSWRSPEKIGQAVRFVLEDGNALPTRVGRLRDQLMALAKDLDRALDEHPPAVGVEQA